MSILGSIGKGAGSILGAASGGLEKGLNFVGLSMIDPRVQLAMQERSRQMEAMGRLKEDGQLPPDILNMFEAGMISPQVMAQVMGYGSEAPASVREWNHYSGLPEEQQRQYLEMKRAAQMLNLGDRFAVRDPVTNQAADIQGGRIELGPDQTLPYKYGASAAQTQGAQDVKAATEPGIQRDIAAATNVGKAATVGEVKRAEILGQAEGEKVADAPNQVIGATKVVGLIDSMIKNRDGLPNIYGSTMGLIPNIRQDSVDLAAVRDQLVADLKLAEAGKLAGQGSVTEAERKLIGDSATILSNPRVSAEAAENEMMKLRDYFIKKQERNAALSNTAKPEMPEKYRKYLND